MRKWMMEGEAGGCHACMHGDAAHRGAAAQRVASSLTLESLATMATLAE